MTREEDEGGTVVKRESAYKYLYRVYSNTKTDGFREALSVALAALRPVTREQVEKAWKGHWITQSALTGQEEICEVNDAGHILGHDATCPYCGEWLVASDEYEVFANFCPSCGKAMSKKAIDIVMERMKELGSNND